MEMAALGTPGITIPIRDEREHEFAAKRLERLGIARLMSSDKMKPRNFANAVLNLLSNEELKKSMSEAGRKLVDGRGAERAAKIVTSLL